MFPESHGLGSRVYVGFSEKPDKPVGCTEDGPWEDGASRSVLPLSLQDVRGVQLRVLNFGFGCQA